MSISELNLKAKKKLTLTLMAVLAVILVLCIVIVSVVGIYNSLSGGVGYSNGLSQDKLTSTVASKTDSLYGTLILVNNSHEYTFPSDDTSGLVNWYAYATNNGGMVYGGLSTSNLKINSEAVTHAHSMLTAMYTALSDKLTDDDKYVVSAAYRSYDDQSALHSTVSAGFSDHHTGYVFTLKRTSKSLSPDDYTWLNENAHNYGFVFRYPDDKEPLTGVSSYPNCLRYVGVAHANLMKQKGLCLEEYIEFLKSDAKKSPASVECSNGEQYFIYYYPFTGMQSDIKVPKDAERYPYTVSGTNDGGIVVTVKVK